MAAKKKARRAAPKARRSPKSKAAKSKAGRHHVANHKYAGKDYECYGKHVNKRGGGKSARMYCGKIK